MSNRMENQLRSKLTGYYPEEELVCGKQVELPWQAKRGAIKYWNAVIVDKDSSTSKAVDKSSDKAANL